MKLTLVFLLLGIVTANAFVYSQDLKIDFSHKNFTVGEALNTIEKNSDYRFLYRNDQINLDRVISVNPSDKTIDEILSSVFQKTGINFKTVENNLIILSPDVQQKKGVSGKVTDTKGQPIVGVSVFVKGTTHAVLTNENGYYTIQLNNNEKTLVFSYIGMKRQEVAIGTQSVIDIVLESEISNLNEVVVVGYGTQKKATLTGSVASVNSKDILTTSNENIENMLTGKLAGIRIVQKSSEPGAFNNTIDIRGFGNPLIVIDGVPRDNIAQLDPNDIASVSVLKDASAAVYGVRAANGVILITTNEGKAGTLKLTYTSSTGIQTPSGLPQNVDAIDWMTLMNEKQMHNVNGGSLAYTQADIDQYRNGTLKSTNWFTPVIDEHPIQTEHNLSASGGSDKINYFFSLGYLNQDGFWKSGDLNYNRYNLRSNINSKITNRLTAKLMISATMDQKNQPFNDTWSIFKSLWRQMPTQSVYANNNPEYLGGTVDGTSPMAMSSSAVSGYQQYNNKWLQNSFSLSYDIPGITGLQVKGMFSYDFSMSDVKRYRKAFNLYTYNASTNIYTPTISQSPDNIYRYYSENPSSLLQGSISYNHLFNGKHNLSALLLYEESTRSGDNFYAQRDLSLEVDQLIAGSSLNQVGYMNSGGLYKLTNKGVVGKFNYDFKSKYLAEFSFRYDGSSKFPPNKQWGLFPAISAGWRISEEPFMKDAAAISFIDNLKLRASYGKVGDDGASSYQFISGYTYPSNGNSQAQAGGAVFDGNFVNAVGFTNLPNPNITWFTTNMLNVGADLDMWHGLLGVSVDVFNRNRNGLLATEGLSLPSTLGAGLPQENLNSDQTRGFEVELNHKSNIGKFIFSLSGNFSYTRTRWLNYLQAKAGNSYQNWTNNLNDRNNDIWWGQGYVGQYQSYNAIINNPTFISRSALPGDYVYQDWNGDGVVDGNDIHPIAANTSRPLINFGLTLNVKYKNFDLNALLQGAAMVWAAYPEALNGPLYFNPGSALTEFMDRWHPLDPTADPYDPNTKWASGYYAYTGTVADQNSERGVHNASYVRLKSLEFGYTLPNNITSKIGISNARIYVNGYNLLTLTGIKNVDPEHPSDLYGYVYPLNKSFNFGLSVSF
ncbi:MAG: TonB-dependent receptor [Bacteroidota bacterium]|nr:TonB-dependent receptor [Bacteroidota bacterium]